MMLEELRGGGKYLYELLPAYFPQGYLTDLEMALWARFYTEHPKKSRLYLG